MDKTHNPEQRFKLVKDVLYPHTLLHTLHFTLKPTLLTLKILSVDCMGASHFAVRGSDPVLEFPSSAEAPNH